MAVPTLNTYSVNHTAIAVRELYIGDEAEINATTGAFGWGVTPIGAAARQAFTQTYSTAAATVAAVTAEALTDNSGGAVSTTLASISDTATKNAVASVNAQLVKINADILADKKVINKLIDALQALGLVL
jgi:hypothetical protein